MLARGLLSDVDGRPGEPEQVTYRQEHVRCGRDECGSCPHGPYWYGYWREDGRTRSQYVGRRLAGEPLEEVVPEGPGGAVS